MLPTYVYMKQYKKNEQTLNLILYTHMGCAMKKQCTLLLWLSITSRSKRAPWNLCMWGLICVSYLKSTLMTYAKHVGAMQRQKCIFHVKFAAKYCKKYEIYRLDKAQGIFFIQVRMKLWCTDLRISKHT